MSWLRGSFAVLLLLATAAGADPVRQVSLSTNDMAYDPVTGKIYASVPSSAGSGGNSITAIDPETGQVGPAVFIGSEPGKLAIGDTGGILWVSLDGAAAVRGFDTRTQTAGVQFSLGSSYGPNYVEDMAVPPGHPETVAVSKYNKGISPRHVHVAIYDNGVQRPKVAAGANVITFGATGGRMYGYHNEITDFTFVRWNVDETGIVSGDGISLLSGFGQDILYDGGRIYGTNGGVYDPEAGTLLGSLPGGVRRPDASLGRVFILQGEGGNVQLLAYDTNTFLKVWSAKIPGVSGGVGSLIRWGRDGLAFRTSGGQVFLLHTGELSTPPPDFTLTVGPEAATGEATVTGTITLTAPAPSSGITFQLTSSSPSAASMPTTVTAPGGATTASFPITAHTVTARTDVTITAAASGVARTTTLHLSPPPVPTPPPATAPQLLLFPNPVTGGLLALGQVILAPPSAGPVTVSLTSSSPAAAVVPASITVAPGANTVTFPIVTFPVAAPTPVTISAACDFGPVTAVLTVLPAGISLPASPPNLLVNGSFEQPALPAGQANQTLRGPGDLPGWRILGGSVDVVSALPAGWQPAPDGGRQSLDLVGNPGAGTIEQTFPTEPGRSYLLSGWVSHAWGIREGRANVFLNGSFFAQLFHSNSLYGTVTPGDLRWQRFTLPFRATASSTTLTITDVTGLSDIGGTVLDGLSVTPGDAAGPASNGGLASPTSLTVSMMTEARVRLTWTDNSGGTAGYEIWRKIGAGDWTRLAAVPPPASTFTDTGVSPSTVYTYRVRATRADGTTSAWSSEAGLTTPAAPAAPTGLTAQATGPTQVSLSWGSTPLNATAIELYRRSSSEGWKLVAVLGPNATGYTDRALQPGTSYTYRARAANDYFASGWSNDAEVTIVQGL